MTAQTYEFRAGTPDDASMLERWLAARHVAKWWRNAPERLAELVAPPTELTIVSLEGAPIGFVALEPTAHSSLSHRASQPAGARAISFCIGEDTALGKGHAAAFVGQFLADLPPDTDGHRPRIIADPDGRNISAVGCLGRIGFQPVGIHAKPPGIKALLMAYGGPPETFDTARPYRRSGSAGRRRARATTRQ